MVCRRFSTWESAPSAVETTLVACVELLDRLLYAVDLGLKSLAGDQTGRIIGAGVDLQSRAQSLAARSAAGL
jgi:hypothetical protein